MGKTRRDFIKTTAAAAGGIALGSHSVLANGTVDNQYLVDTRSADSSAWRDDVEIVAEATQVGFASVRGSEDALEGLEYAQEIEYELSPPEPLGDDSSAESAESLDVSGVDAETSSGSIPEPHPLQWDKKAQGVAKLHEQGMTGDGAKIAIVDGGIARDHPDLQNLNEEDSKNFSASEEFVGGYHGTHVAGIAAGTGASADESDYWVVGMAPEAELVDMKVFPFRSSADFLDAIEEAIAVGCDVANMSFGPGSPYGPSVSSHLNAKAYTRLGRLARDNGTLLVESAGNADVNIDTHPELSTNTGKGTDPGYLSISATGPVTDPENFDPANPEFGTVADTTAPSYYSSYGPESIDISAPGGNALTAFTLFDAVFSTLPEGVPGFSLLGDRYGHLHGTSMAAPNVTGAAALIAAENPGATPTQLKQQLRTTATTIDEAPPDIMEEGGYPMGYFEATNSIDYEDSELEDPYSSETYRGQGHLDTVMAVAKDIPDALEGGVEVDGRTYYPLDMDNDGLYEDVNGDGMVDMDDVELLYQLALRGVVGRGTTAFDFNGDGRFDMYDVQALLRKVRG